jgi:hypothetical protein
MSPTACLARLGLALGLASALAGCAAQSVDGPAPGAAIAPGEVGTASTTFRAEDFVWSTAPGSGSVSGVMAYRDGARTYSCQGRDVILTPETPWTRMRMIVLYGSAVSASAPLDVVRARTPASPAGDYARYVRKTTCGEGNRFSFSGLPQGAWYAITLARPVDGVGGELAVMRRVTTRAGAATTVTLN